MNDYFFPFSETPILTPQLTGGREVYQLPPGNHHAPEGRPSSKTEPKKLPNVSSEILEKQHFSTIFRQLLLHAAVTECAF